MIEIFTLPVRVMHVCCLRIADDVPHLLACYRWHPCVVHVQCNYRLVQLMLHDARLQRKCVDAHRLASNNATVTNNRNLSQCCILLPVRRNRDDDFERGCFCQWKHDLGRAFHKCIVQRWSSVCNRGCVVISRQYYMLMEENYFQGLAHAL